MNARRIERTETVHQRDIRESAKAGASWSSFEKMKITGDGWLTVKVC